MIGLRIIGWRIGLLKFHVRATDLGRQ
jgi:hypothetical protein